MAKVYVESVGFVLGCFFVAGVCIYLGYDAHENLSRAAYMSIGWVGALFYSNTRG
jgi:hypothetical protein